MEKVLLRLAKQLNAFDEASLMALWDTYAQKVQHFEPTRRWEEAALVFSLLQAMRWKNQLFNYHWSSGVKPGSTEHISGLAADDPLGSFLEEEPQGPRLSAVEQQETKQKAKVLQFRPREETPDDGVDLPEDDD